MTFQNGDIKIEMDSSLSKMFQKDNGINLNTFFKIEQIWTKNWHILFKKDEFFQKAFTKDCLRQFNQVFLEKISTCKDEYLNLIDVLNLETYDRLFNFLEKNSFDFIIVNPLRAAGFLALKYLLVNFDTDTHTTIEYQGLFNKKIKFYINHDWNMNNDLIICGKENSLKYNYRIDSFNYVENADEVDGQLKLYLDFEYNPDDFCNLYLVTHKSNKYLNFLRKNSIDELL